MRLLLAEDDRIISQGLIAALRKTGYAVDHVNNGADADTALVSQPYDLLIWIWACRACRESKY